MAINFTREPNSTDLLIRVNQELFVHRSLDAYVEEMSKAISTFVQTDPEVRILINEMVRTAFGQVDLLKLVTKAVRDSMLEASKTIEVKPTEDTPHV